MLSSILHLERWWYDALPWQQCKQIYVERKTKEESGRESEKQEKMQLKFIQSRIFRQWIMNTGEHSHRTQHESAKFKNQTESHFIFLHCSVYMASLGRECSEWMSSHIEFRYILDSVTMAENRVISTIFFVLSRMQQPAKNIPLKSFSIMWCDVLYAFTLTSNTIELMIADSVHVWVFWRAVQKNSKFGWSHLAFGHSKNGPQNRTVFSLGSHCSSIFLESFFLKIIFNGLFTKKNVSQLSQMDFSCPNAQKSTLC